MEYSKEFLSQFKVDATNYTYVPVDNQPHVVPLIRKGTTKKFTFIKCMNSEIFKPSLLPDKDKTEFIKQVQQEYKHIGSIKYRPGSTLWQFNTETGELKPAKVTVKEQLVWTSKGDCTKKTRSVIYEDKCVYMWALNRKNAEKKILRVINNVIRKRQENQ